MKYYMVTYSGPFGFIKPWTAVRDAGGGFTFSQQFLTPSIIEGIRQKLGVNTISRHKLRYYSISDQQEVVKAKAWTKKGKSYFRESSILTRGILINPILNLLFEEKEDAIRASKQHLCLCRNEDILLPYSEMLEISIEDFNQLEGFELRFEKNEQSFQVGYNRFDNNKAMYGWIDIVGNPIISSEYE